ncbi:MAG: hypothetical protein AAGF59_06170, partial [Pseudomonadota bacterium]
AISAIIVLLFILSVCHFVVNLDAFLKINSENTFMFAFFDRAAIENPVVMMLQMGCILLFVIPWFIVTGTVASIIDNKNSEMAFTGLSFLQFFVFIGHGVALHRVIRDGSSKNAQSNRKHRH